MSASGTSPSAAEEALSTTGEKANFLRLTRLMMRGGLPLLREVFDSIHPLASLPGVLQANKVRLQNLTTATGNKVFSYAERKCLYNPHGPGTYGESAEFDITILYKLFRSICSLPAPKTGWDKLPNSTDDSREADIVRIRCYRNTIYSHNRLMEVTDADFVKLWMDIRDTLLRIAGGISSAKKDEWKKAIEKFFHKPLTPDAQECLDELQFWYLSDMETKHELEKIDENIKQVLINQAQMQKQQELLNSKLDIFIAAIQQEPITSRNSALEVDGAQSPSESVETRISIPQEQPSAEGTAGQSTSTELPASQQNNTEVQNFWDDVYSSKRSLNRLKKYLKKKFGTDVQGDRRGSLIISISCSSLEVLEELWKEYRTGHLNEVIQVTLVTAEVLVKLNLKEVKLRTIISEEDYLSYKEFLNKSAGKGEGTIPIHQAQGSPAKELVEAMVEKPISLTKPVSHQQLANLSKVLGSNWRRLGSLLGIPEQRLENLSSTYKREHNKGKEMLYEWKNTIDGAATKDLQEKLEKMGMGHLLKLIEGTQETQQKRKHRRARGEGKVRISQVQGSPAMELVEGKTVSTTSRTVPTTAEFLAGLDKGKPSQVVKDGYIVRSAYVLIINNHPIASESNEKSVFADKFGFTTREDIYLTTSDMLKALTDTAQRDFSNNDCFCCIIRSTGTEHGICGTDDKPIDIKTITSLFTSDKCPSLDGKPKLFVLIPKKFEYQSPGFPGLLGYVTQFEARSKLRHLVISEKDFLVWNRFGEKPSSSYRMSYILGCDWLECLLEGMHLRKAIAAVASSRLGSLEPSSLLSTLEKNVFFERNDSPYTVVQSALF